MRRHNMEFVNHYHYISLSTTDVAEGQTVRYDGNRMTVKQMLHIFNGAATAAFQISFVLGSLGMH